VQKILVADGYENADVRYDPSRPSTIPLRLMDNSAARRQLGFEAKTSLEEGLRRTIQWYRTTAKAA
jgi:GDP-L-fucose synthase